MTELQGTDLIGLTENLNEYAQLILNMQGSIIFAVYLILGFLILTTFVSWWRQ